MGHTYLEQKNTRAQESGVGIHMTLVDKIFLTVLPWLRNTHSHCSLTGHIIYVGGLK